MTEHKRLKVARGPLLKRAAAATFDGTTEILVAVVGESTGVPCWRPVRAAAVLAMAAKNAHRIHMTAAEFEAFALTHFGRPHGISIPRMFAALSIGRARMKAILAGEPVKLWEALACAHYAAGLPLPIELTPEAFEAWFLPRFGAAQAVGAAVQIKPEHIADFMRGYAVHTTGRYERKPDPGRIRALDWLLRVGPFSPWGDRLQAAAFPGQEV